MNLQQDFSWIATDLHNRERGLISLCQQLEDLAPRMPAALETSVRRIISRLRDAETGLHVARYMAQTIAQANEEVIDILCDADTEVRNILPLRKD